MQSEDKQRLITQSGKFWILLVGLATLLAGWKIYESMMVPRWMRDFGLDMAARACIVSTNPQDTVFSTMKGRAEPENPYIYLANSARFDWDRVYVVGSGGQVSEPLINLEWNGKDLEVLNRRMRQDDRYQLIAFERDRSIVDHGFYFTMWADLSALTRPEGLSRSEAVFVADSDGEIYSLSIAGANKDTSCQDIK